MTSLGDSLSDRKALSVARRRNRFRDQRVRTREADDGGKTKNGGETKDLRTPGRQARRSVARPAGSCFFEARHDQGLEGRLAAEQDSGLDLAEDQFARFHHPRCRPVVSQNRGFAIGNCHDPRQFVECPRMLEILPAPVEDALGIAGAARHKKDRARAARVPSQRVTFAGSGVAVYKRGLTATGKSIF